MKSLVLSFEAMAKKWLIPFSTKTAQGKTEIC